MGQRGLNIGQFTKLIEGRLPAHSPDQLDCRGFHLPGEVGGPVLPAPSPAALELLPVLKHGSAIAHILGNHVPYLLTSELYVLADTAVTLSLIHI